MNLTEQAKQGVTKPMNQNFYTKITNLNQISVLEKKQLKSQLDWHYSLFFKSKDSSIDHLLEHEALILFVRYGIVSAGNIENVTAEYTGKTYEDFVNTITI